MLIKNGQFMCRFMYVPIYDDNECSQMFGKFFQHITSGNKLENTFRIIVYHLLFKYKSFFRLCFYKI